ncbi:MAG: hypothetical protein JNM10_20050 [Planctomycetia bacterium]|nr:hypothetical protein [Planctomycetia bacterium]
MRRLTSSLLAALIAALCLAGCGGGGGGGSGSAGSVALAGRVALRDGSTANLGGIGLTLPATGQRVTTRSDGSFAFGLVPAGDLAIALVGGTSAATVVSTRNGGDDDEDEIDDRGTDGGGDDGTDDQGGGNDDDDGDDDNGGDDDGDDDDVGDDDSDLRDLGRDDVVEVRLEVRGGRIEAITTSCSRDARREARVRLERAADADDTDATGSVKVESRTDREKLEVEAGRLASGRSVEAVVVCDGVEASLGLRTVDATGRAEWEISTNDGGVLPHGALDVAALAGCTVEVRDGDVGATLLFGTVPELPAAVAPGGGSADDEARARGRGALVRTADGTGKGYVELRRRVKDGEVRQRFKVEAEGQTPGASLDVYVEDPSNPGTPAFVATRTVDAFGEAELELDTHDGASLPFGVTDVTQFVGLTVEVRRTSDGVVILRGAAPSLLTD